MASQYEVVDGLNMQQRLDQLATIDEDAFAEYFIKHMRDIFQFKKSSVIELLDDRDKPTITTIRNTLLLHVGELHEGYKNRTAINRQNMNKAHEDIYILGYNCLNPARASADLSTVYREDSKAGLSQAALETITEPVAEVVASNGTQHTNGDSNDGSPHGSEDNNGGSPHDSVDNNGGSPHDSEENNDSYNRHTEEQISHICQHLVALKKYIRDSFIASNDKQDQQLLNINELRQENSRLNSVIENHVNQIAMLEVTQAKMQHNINGLQKFVTELTNGAAAIVEQHTPYSLQTVSGTTAAVAIIAAVAKVADAPAGEDAIKVASPAPVVVEENNPSVTLPGLLPVMTQQDRLPKLDAAPTLEAAMEFNIFIGNVDEKHSTEDIKEFISTRSKIERQLIKVNEFPQRQEGSRAFKVAVPKNKTVHCLNLPWNNNIKAEHFKPKSNRATSGHMQTTKGKPTGKWSKGRYGSKHSGHNGFHGHAAGSGMQPTQHSHTSNYWHGPSPQPHGHSASAGTQWPAGPQWPSGPAIPTGPQGPTSYPPAGPIGFAAPPRHLGPSGHHQEPPRLTAPPWPTRPAVPPGQFGPPGSTGYPRNSFYGNY